MSLRALICSLALAALAMSLSIPLTSQLNAADVVCFSADSRWPSGG